MKSKCILDQQLYFVKLDLSDAFGCIKHDLLLTLLENYVNTLPKKSITYLVKSLQSTNGNISNKRLFLEENKDHQFDNKMRLITTGEDMTLDTKKTFELIKRYVKHQGIASGRKKYAVVEGIPQGGFLSTLLCDYYYSAMYYKHWRCNVGADDLLMHTVDDFIYCSVDCERAQAFLSKISQSVPEFNCRINSAKTGHNVSDPGADQRFTFFGITFCVQSKQILVSVPQILTSPPRFTMGIRPLFGNKKVGRLSRKTHLKNRNMKYFAQKVNRVTMARLNTSVIRPEYQTPGCILSNIYRTGEYILLIV